MLRFRSTGIVRGKINLTLLRNASTQMRGRQISFDTKAIDPSKSREGNLAGLTPNLATQFEARGRKSIKLHSKPVTTDINPFIKSILKRTEEPFYKSYGELLMIDGTQRTYVVCNKTIQDVFFRIWTSANSLDSTPLTYFVETKPTFASSPDELLALLLFYAASNYTNLQDYGDVFLNSLKEEGISVTENKSLLNKKTDLPLLKDPITKALMKKIVELYNSKSFDRYNNVIVEEKDVTKWIQSLLEPSISASIGMLKDCKMVPESVLYDLLLRPAKSKEDANVQAIVHNNWSELLNKEDQNRLESIKVRLKNNAILDSAPYPNRLLQLPFAFQNFFFFALKNDKERLESIISVYIKGRNVTQSVMNELCQILWYLSLELVTTRKKVDYDNIMKAYEAVIGTLNIYMKKYNVGDLNITALIASAICESLTNPSKAKSTLKFANERFKLWEIQSFDIDGFEKVLHNNKDKYLGKLARISLSGIRQARRDYSVKLMVADILVTAGMNAYDSVYRILNSKDQSLFKCYDELWEVLTNRLLKQGYMNSEKAIELIQLNLQSDETVYNPTVVKSLLYHVNDLSFINDTISALYTRGYVFGDQFISSWMIKQYKVAAEKASQMQSSSNDIKTLISSITSNSDFKKAATQTSYGAFDSSVSLARYIAYHRSGSEHLPVLGTFLVCEAVENASGTYSRYSKWSKQPTQDHLASLLIGAAKLRTDLSLEHYLQIEWDGLSPVERAISEFEKYTQHSFDDNANLIVPQNRLWLNYIALCDIERDSDRLVGLLYRWTDMRHKVPKYLLNALFKCFPQEEIQTLLNAYNQYKSRMEKLASINHLTEYQLKKIKETESPLPETTLRFKSFIDSFDSSYEVISTWDWPLPEETITMEKN